MTRYPKKGKGTKWTALELKAVPKEWKGDTLTEERLQGDVRVSADGEVSVHWRTSYKWCGSLKWFYCGTFPLVSLEDIRAQRDWCKEQVRKGLHPGDKKKLDRVESQANIERALADEEARKARDRSFGELVEDWFTLGVKRENDNAELRRMFAKDVLPKIGQFPLRLVSYRELSQVIQGVTKRGAHRMAVQVYLALVQLYGWAIERSPWRSLLNEGQEGDPMRLVEIRKFLPDDYDMDNVGERTLLDEEIVALRDALRNQRNAYESAPNKRKVPQPLEITSELALWLCLGTMCRIGELSLGEWKEVNFLEGTWHIPKEHVKKTRAGRKALLVYLSPYAIRNFKALYEITGGNRHMFPSINDKTKHRDIKTVTKQIGDRQARFKKGGKLTGRRYDDSLVLGDEQWTPHDLRRTAATIMEELGIEADVIDRCQNHTLRSQKEGPKSRRHYQQASLRDPFQEKMRTAWLSLGNHLDTLLGS